MEKNIVKRFLFEFILVPLLVTAILACVLFFAKQYCIRNKSSSPTSEMIKGNGAIVGDTSYTLT